MVKIEQQKYPQRQTILWQAASGDAGNDDSMTLVLALKADFPPYLVFTNVSFGFRDFFSNHGHKKGQTKVSVRHPCSVLIFHP